MSGEEILWVKDFFCLGKTHFAVFKLIKRKRDKTTTWKRSFKGRTNLDRLRNTSTTAWPAIPFQPYKAQATVTRRSLKEDAHWGRVWGGLVVLGTWRTGAAAYLKHWRFCSRPQGMLPACLPTWVAIQPFCCNSWGGSTALQVVGQAQLASQLQTGNSRILRMKGSGVHEITCSPAGTEL